jgi:hypothetical protein
VSWTGLKFKKLMGRAKKDSSGETDSNATSPQAKDKGDSSSESYEEPPERRTEDEEWYHGEMGRKEAENLCVRDGDYIVRISGQRGYVLTTRWMSMPKHFIIQTDDEVSCSNCAYVALWLDLLLMLACLGIDLTV